MTYLLQTPPARLAYRSLFWPFCRTWYQGLQVQTWWGSICAPFQFITNQGRYKSQWTHFMGGGWYLGAVGVVRGWGGTSAWLTPSATLWDILCFIRACCFSPWSEDDVYSHCSHLNVRVVESCWRKAVTAVFSAAFDCWEGAPFETSTTTSSAIFSFCASLLLCSLRIWLGDFFFFLTQELAANSLLSNLNVSLPMERVKVNFWLADTTAWQKARHLSTVPSILGPASSHSWHFGFIFWSCDLVDILYMWTSFHFPTLWFQLALVG